jgi:2-polyprenyl-3-methyl-5-hydroxy-6-metoxy-1,4-benzoquinol methylase
MVECAGCAGVSPDPYPSAEEIDSFYLTADEASEWEQEHYVNPCGLPGQQEAAKALVEHMTALNMGRTGSLMEVGCAGGWLLAAARDAGWKVLGVEAAPKFARFAADSLKLEIVQGLVGDIDPEQFAAEFDVIMMFDVFEHLHDPARDLMVLRKMIRGEGHLLIATPNIASPVARMWGLRWRQILPSHINYSTPPSMKAILNRTGWTLERTSEPRYWNPEIKLEKRARSREQLKFLIRLILYVTIVGPSTRILSLKRLPALLSRGRMSWESFIYRAGDQPVLGDVMFVVARPGTRI